MGVILADFHSLGRRPCLNDKLKSILRGTADVSAVSLNKRSSRRAGILSTPQDLLALRQLSSSWTSLVSHVTWLVTSSKLGSCKSVCIGAGTPVLCLQKTE